jgi:hypothetical protein
MLETRREEFVRLFREFARKYPQTPDGQNVSPDRQGSCPGIFNRTVAG